jgi:hypothetical protein
VTVGDWVIDGHTLIDNPDDDVYVFREDLFVSWVKTYGGVQVFEWPPTIIGKPFDLTWTFMTASEFDILDASCKKTSIILDAQLPSGVTFTIKPTYFNAKYFRSTLTTGKYRKEVKMSFVVLAEIMA